MKWYNFIYFSIVILIFGRFILQHPTEPFYYWAGTMVCLCELVHITLSELKDIFKKENG